MKIKRINHLLRAYYFENKKRLFGAAIIIFAVAVLESINGLLEISPLVYFGVMIGLAGMFFQSSLKRENSVHFFNLPVTAGEKLVNAMVVLSVLFVVFHLIMVAGTYMSYYLLRPVFYSGENILVAKGKSIWDLSIWFWEGYLLFAAAISVFLFGSIYFKKNAFLITLACGVGFLFVIPIYNWLLILVAFNSSNPFTGGEYPIEYTAKINMFNPAFFYGGFESVLFIAATLFFLALTYLRLKETEV